MLMSLTDDVIDATCARFHVVPDGCSKWRDSADIWFLTPQLGFSNTLAAVLARTRRILATQYLIEKALSLSPLCINGDTLRLPPRIRDA